MNWPVFLLMLLSAAMCCATTVKEQYVAVTGGRVYTRTVGAEKPGVPLLVLHGGPGTSWDYLEPLEALDRPVVFYDQLGCGNSDRPDDVSLWTVERYAHEVTEVRAALGLERIHLLGQSWGAMLAAEYLLREHPQGVQSCTFSGPLLDANAWEADQRRYLAELPPEMQQAVAQAEATGNYDAADYQQAMNTYYAAHVCRLQTWPDCLNRAMEKLNMQVYLHMWGPSEFTVTGTLKHSSCLDRLPGIGLPVLLTCGQFDEAAPATVERFCKLFPNARMVVFEDASHESHLEKTDEYLNALSQFLSEAEDNTQ